MTTAIIFLGLGVVFGSFIIADALLKVADEIKKSNNLKCHINNEYRLKDMADCYDKEEK